jgi:hypothetical protein
MSYPWKTWAIRISGNNLEFICIAILKAPKDPAEPWDVRPEHKSFAAGPGGQFQ